MVRWEDVYRREGLRIQKWRTGGGAAAVAGGEGEGRLLMSRRRDLEEPVRERVACRVEDRQCGMEGAGRDGDEVGRKSCHLKRVRAEVALLK